MPLRTARFYNASWPGLLNDVKLRGYGNPRIQEVRVDMEADFGPTEAGEVCQKPL